MILSDPCVCAELSGIARGQTLQVAGRKHIKLYMAKGCFDVPKTILERFLRNGFRHCCFERYQIASYVTCRDNEDCTINLLYTSLVSNLNPKSISDETAANKRFSLSKTLFPPVETTFGHIYLEWTLAKVRLNIYWEWFCVQIILMCKIFHITINDLITL